MLQQSPQIRAAQQADRAALLQMLAVGDPALGTQLRAWLGSGDLLPADAMLASLGRELAGVACAPLREVHSEGAWQPFGVLCALYVAPGMRGLRLGSRMLDALIERHRADGARGMLTAIAAGAPEWTAGILERRGFAPLWRSTAIEVPASLGGDVECSEREADVEECQRAWAPWAEAAFPVGREAHTPAGVEWRLLELDGGTRLLARMGEGVAYDPIPLDPIEPRRAAVAIAALHRQRFPELRSFRWHTAEGSEWAKALGPQASSDQDAADTLYLMGFDRVVDIADRRRELHGIALL
ncbi:MAG: GNAT family N-acetyltransferase [Armatimonadia bacterium]|nr:GNAT family N-acetyltransferase [Armatimonadia bacterium]